MATNQGLIKLIILLIIAIIVLGYFGISLKAIFGQETVRGNLDFVWQTASYVWENYLKSPVIWVWNVFYNLLWRSFVENAERIRGGKPPLLLEGQPQMPDSKSQQ